MPPTCPVLVASFNTTVRALQAFGYSTLTDAPEDIEVSDCYDFERVASAAVGRPVLVEYDEGALIAKVADWPATSDELAVSMERVRRRIADLGTRGIS